MGSMTNVLDSFVRKLKETGDFSHVRFIHAGRGAFAEKPVGDFLVACGVGKEELLRESTGSEMHSGNLAFCVYAPEGESKRALTLLSQKIAETLHSVDEERHLAAVTVSDSSFDSNMSVWKQEIHALYEGAVNAPSQGCVYFGTQKLEDVLSFEVKQENSVYELRELLAGDIEEHINRETKYTITICLQGDVPAGIGNGEFNLYRESADMTYDDCRLVKVLSKADGTQELTIVCRRAHRGMEVTV